ncbi:MAG: energy-coupled thiamine transporter ThiT [Lachnospiraceae bacterium]|nr:energy-coupled thiamine transporter ThiT [Lachnospiraceae bacterium]
MRNSKVLILSEGAVMVALATALSLVKIFKLPWGGSVTLLSMLPIVFFSIRRGLVSGFAASFAYALVQLFLDLGEVLSWGLTPGTLIACFLLDYIFAFAVVGIAGIFRKKGTSGYIYGTVLAVCLRFIVHFLSGVILWKSYGELWGDFFTENTVLYSICYNGAYMLPELILTVVAIVIMANIPQSKRLFIAEK